MTTVRELVVSWGFDIDDSPLKKLEAGIKGVQNAAVRVGNALASAAKKGFGFNASALGKRLTSGLAGLPEEMGKLGGEAGAALNKALTPKQDPLMTIHQGMEGIRAAAFRAGLAVSGVAATLFALAKTTANAGDEIKDTSIAIGISGERLQELGFAGQLSGSSMDEVAQSLKFLSRNAYSAAQGSQQSAEAFARVGVSVRDASGALKPVDALMLEVSDRFKTMPNGVEKTAIAMELFGRSGGKFVQLLNEGSASIESMGQQARRMGLVLSNDALDAADAFNDQFGITLAVIKSVAKAIGMQLIPPIQRLMVHIVSLVQNNFGSIKRAVSGIIDLAIDLLNIFMRVMHAGVNLGQGIYKALGGAGKAGDNLLTIVKAIGVAFGLWQLGQLAMSIASVVKGFLLMGASSVAAFAIPIAMGAALLAAFLIIEDIVGYFNHKDSVFGEFMKAGDKIPDAIGKMLDALGRVVETKIREIGGKVGKWLGFDNKETQGFLDNILGPMKSALSGILEFGKTAANTFKENIPLIVAAWTPFKDALGNTWHALKDLLDSLGGGKGTGTLFGEALTAAITGPLKLMTALLNVTSLFIDVIRVAADGWAFLLGKEEEKVTLPTYEVTPQRPKDFSPGVQRSIDSQQSPFGGAFASSLGVINSARSAQSTAQPPASSLVSPAAAAVSSAASVAAAPVSAAPIGTPMPATAAVPTVQAGSVNVSVSVSAGATVDEIANATADRVRKEMAARLRQAADSHKPTER